MRGWMGMSEGGWVLVCRGGLADVCGWMCVGVGECIRESDV